MNELKLEALTFHKYYLQNHMPDCVLGTNNMAMDEKNGLRAVTGEEKKIIRNYKQKSKLLLTEKISSDRAHSN